MPSGYRIALPALLFASLVLNGVLLLRDPASSAERSKRPGKQRVAALASQSAAVTERQLLQCRHRLQVQLLRTAHLTRAQLTALHKPPENPVDEDPAIAAPPARADFTAQQQMLCTLGLESLRRHWGQGKEVIHANLTRDLASTEAQTSDLDRALKTFGTALNLSGRELGQLEKRYVGLRSKRVGAALTALDADPPDYLAAFDEALDLYQDTDLLVENLYGTQAVDKVRGADLRRRTMVLAVLASLADVEWDRSIEW